ncbi:MAG: HEXXH motif-containing putative peptide modification protein [Trebonia sp.]|jgi:HEXXH motif-containing protein
MSRPVHALSAADFAALAAGGGGPAAIAQLVGAEHRNHLLLLSGVVNEARATGHREATLAAEGYSLLCAARDRNPDAALRVIRYPSVGAWALRTLLALRGGQVVPGATPGGLRAVAAAAALRAGQPAEIMIGAVNGLATLPSLGAAFVSMDTVFVRSLGGTVTVGPVRLPGDPHLDGPGWIGLRRVRAGALDVLIDDLDPFRHPATSSPPERQAVDSWTEMLVQAWAVLQAHHPRIAAEVAGAVQVITPIATSAGRRESSSSPELFGTVAMSLPPDPVTGAEALAHEIQHVKLGALLNEVKLTLPDDGSRYYAPWRADPRPVSGLLQGAYAYLGVSGFWRRQRRQWGHEEHGDAEFARWRAAAATAVATLQSSGRLTDDGLEFVAGMAGTLGPWQHEFVSAAALASAEREASGHLARWQAAHGTATAGLSATGQTSGVAAPMTLSVISGSSTRPRSQIFFECLLKLAAREGRHRRSSRSRGTP